MKEQKRIHSKRKLRTYTESQNGGASWSSVGHIISALKHTLSFFPFVNHTLIHHQFSVMLRNISIILFEFFFIVCFVFCAQIRKEKEKISPNHSFI